MEVLRHQAIQKIYDGRKFISTAVAELLVTDIFHDENEKAHEFLSDREFEILKLVIKGKTAIIIASSLGISDKTVSTYRSRILKKLNMKNTADLIHYAIANNISD